jgi:hypothetical protein
MPDQPAIVTPSRFCGTMNTVANSVRTNNGPLADRVWSLEGIAALVL